MAANRIYIQVDFQSASAEEDIKKLNQNIANIGKESEKATDQATKGMKGLTVSVETTSDSIAQLSKALAGLGIAAFLKQMLSVGEEINRMNRAFDRFAGGPQLKAQLDDLADSLGLSRRAMEQLGLASHSTGTKINEIVPIITVVSGVLARNAKLTTENLKTMMDVINGIGAQGYTTVKQVASLARQSASTLGQELAKNWGDNIEGLKGAFGIGGMSGVDAKALMINAFQGLGSGMKALSEEAKSLTAEWERFKNATDKLGVSLTNALGSNLVMILKLLTELLRVVTDLVDAFGKMPEPLKQLAIVGGEILLVFSSVKKVADILKGVFSGGVLAKGMKWAATLGTDTALLDTAAVAAGTGAGAAAGTAVVGGGIMATLAAIGPAGWAAIAAAVIAGVGYYLLREGPPTQTVTNIPLLDLTPKKHLFDPEAIKAREEAAQAMLDQERARAMKINMGNVQAAGMPYEHEIRKSIEQFGGAGVGTYRQAQSLAMSNEVAKIQEESRRAVLKGEQDYARTQRQIAITQAEVIPDDSYAGRIALAGLKSSAWEADYRAVAGIRTGELERTRDLEKAGAPASKRLQIEQAYNAQIVEVNKNADAEIQDHRLKAAKETNALLEQYHQELMKEFLSDELAMIDRTAALRSTYLGAARPGTIPEHLNLIADQAATDRKRVQDTTAANLAAAREALDHYERLNPGGVGVTEEREKFAREAARLNLSENTQLQQIRINSWRQANEVILQDQQEMYDRVKTGLGQVWDAFTDRTRSIWSSIGNLIKSTILGALKTVVTSQLASQVSGFLSGGAGPTFPRGYFHQPYFPGLGAIPAIQGMPSSATSVTYPAATMSPEQQMINNLRGVFGGQGAPSGIGADIGLGGSWGGGTGYAERTGDYGGAAAGGVGGYGPYGSGGGPLGLGGMAVPGYTPRGGGGMNLTQSLAKLRESFNIGKTIALPGGTNVSWATASPMQRLRSVMSSPGVSSLSAGLGTALFTSAIGGRGIGSDIKGVAGGAMAGYGLATTFSSIPGAGQMGLVGGAGAGLMMAGWKHGGALGVGLDTLGGAMTGAAIGGLFGGPLGMAIGAGVGAAVGLGMGVARLFVKSKDEQLRALIKQTYGIDMPDAGIRKQILDLADQKYNGDIRLAVFSVEVQDIIRAYSMATGHAANLPRPMYAANFQQSGSGLQMQPVYSGGQLVANPYSGITSTQFAASATPVFMQLNPEQAAGLFSGQVVKVLGDNPAAVAQSNASAVRAGQSRQAQSGGLLEPGTVMA